MIAQAVAVLGMALGAATCPLPGPEAGTALDYASVEGFLLTEGDELFVRFAPIFLVEDYDAPYNRIGTPSARFAADGEEEIYVDPAKPTYYVQKVRWSSAGREYTNLIYRVHFEMGKSNDSSRDGGKGYNVGLLVIVTLNEEEQPVWLNAVGSCGCFHAILPTTFTPEQAYPDDWDKERFEVYGEHLPGFLAYPRDFDHEVRPVLFLRAGSHRVADIEVASIPSVREQYTLTPAHAAPMNSLKHLKLGNGETSFYYEEGKNKGLVKGAYKRGEAILLGLWMGDGRVGQDRIYGPPEELPRGFYTTINRFEKDDSDMWDYKSFLEQNGWKP